MDSVFCTKCGNYSVTGSRFCMGCGAEIGRSAMARAPRKPLGAGRVLLWILGVFVALGFLGHLAQSTGNVTAIADRPAKLREWAASGDLGKQKAAKICYANSDWGADDCDRVARGVISIGMNSEQVRMSWGKPEKINTTAFSGETHEQWVYGQGQYVYIENGRVTSMQDSK